MPGTKCQLKEKFMDFVEAEKPRREKSIVCLGSEDHKQTNKQKKPETMRTKAQFHAPKMLGTDNWEGQRILKYCKYFSSL